MGKKKSFYKKQVKSFVKSNRLLFAALGGVAAGISIAALLGTEKAKEILHTVENNVRDFKNKIASDLQKEPVASEGSL
jgi:hypothetical protein